MNFSKKSGKKKGAAAVVVCFVAAIAIAGTYTFNDYKKSQGEKEIAKAEEMDFTEESLIDEAVDGEVVSNEAADTNDGKTADESAVLKDGETSNEETGLETEETANEIAEYAEEAGTVENVASNHAASVNFTSDSKLLWPVAGSVLMDYSMDKTVYFKTLDQYKYNPAMVIAGAQGDQVIAGTSGIVKSIDNTAETGTTVNIDMGNGYEAFYGQLVSVQVKTGDYVDATTILGYVAEPTKYYSSEGSNLYFAMRKDGQPVNPKDFLVE